jgi:hypothetical protein
LPFDILAGMHKKRAVQETSKAKVLSYHMLKSIPLGKAAKNKETHELENTLQIFFLRTRFQTESEVASFRKSDGNFMCMRMCLHLSFAQPHRIEFESPTPKVTSSQEDLHSAHCSALTLPLKRYPSITRELHDFSLTYGKFVISSDLFTIYSPKLSF